MNVTAVCERSGSWWAVTVLEIEGGFTQAKRLDQVPAMVADLVSLATGVPEADVHVEVKAEVPAVARQLWDASKRLAAEAQALQAEGAARAAAAVAELSTLGLSVRDIGTLLKVSPQRVSQLNHTGRTFTFTGTNRAGHAYVTDYDAHVVRHAVAPGNSHIALCGAALSEVLPERPWSVEPSDEEDVCHDCAAKAAR
jgi:hypothetical protein